MTLNITIATPRAIYQCADYRLFDLDTRTPIDFQTQKVVAVNAFHWSALVAFAGVGRTRRVKVDEWLADRVKSIGGDEPFERLVEQLTTAEEWLADVPPPHNRHSFSVGAFVGGAPTFVLVSNFEQPSGEQKTEASQKLSVFTVKPHRALTFIAGQKSAVSRPERKRLAVAALADVVDGDVIRATHRTPVMCYSKTPEGRARIEALREHVTLTAFVGPADESIGDAVVERGDECGLEELARNIAEPKSERSRRVVALPSFAIEALKRQREQQGGDRLLAGSKWVDGGLVFTSTIGTPLDERNVRRAFKAVLKAAGLPTLRIHDLRHTTATLLLTQGVHPRVVMETLGHSQISLTLDTYSHVLPSLQAEAANRMQDALGENGCQNGCQNENSASTTSQELRNSEGKVVSRLGIEPRTRRLRVCCSAN
jgi:hypothetical protein